MGQEKRSCESRGWMPLTLAQLDFWEEYALHPDQSVSTVAHCLDIEGAVDQPALVEAITRTVHEADILSVRFREQSGRGEPQQRCDTVQAPMLELRDLHGQPAPLETARRLMREDIESRLDLMRQPLSVQWLLRVGERRYLWYSRGHHIILDGYGMVLLERRCAQLYAHLLGAGRPVSRCARSPASSTRRRPIAAAGGSTKTGATGTPISMPAPRFPYCARGPKPTR